MELILKRIAKKKDYTIGRLYIDNQYFCDTLEDTDRGLKQSMSEKEIKKIKIPGKTAIPTGTYKINMNIVSPRFGSKAFYKAVCNGKLPRLMGVPGFQGVLIHVGDGSNGHLLTEGCLLVGKNKIVGGLLEGRDIFTKLVRDYLIPSNKRNEQIKITIQ